MALPANHSSFAGVFNGRGKSLFLWPPSLSGLDRSLGSITFETVHVDRNNVTRVGLLQKADMKLRHDKILWVDADTYGSSTEMSAWNAELIKKAARTRGGIQVDNSPFKRAAFPLNFKVGRVVNQNLEFSAFVDIFTQPL